MAVGLWFRVAAIKEHTFPPVGPHHDFLPFFWPGYLCWRERFSASWKDVILKKTSICSSGSHGDASFVITVDWTFSSSSFSPSVSTFFPPDHSTPAQFLPLQFARHQFVLVHHSWTQDFLCSGYVLVPNINHFHNDSTVSTPRVLAWWGDLFQIATTSQMSFSWYFVQNYIIFIHSNEDFCCWFE